MARKTALARYNLRVLALSALYVFLLLWMVWLFKRHALHGALAYAGALLPALPIVGIFVAIGRYLVEEDDEYVRMMTVRQLLIASGFALSIATIWGFLESFDLVRHVDAYYIAVLWFAGLAVGGVVNKIGAGRQHDEST